MALLIILLVLGALDLCWFLFERVKEKSTKAKLLLHLDQMVLEKQLMLKC